MSYLLAVFRSRNQTTAFFQLCASSGIVCAVVNTPREANVGCGISVKFAEGSLAIVRRLLSLHEFGTFAGIFRVRAGLFGRTVERVT